MNIICSGGEERETMSRCCGCGMKEEQILSYYWNIHCEDLSFLLAVEEYHHWLREARDLMSHSYMGRSNEFLGVCQADIFHLLGRRL